MTDKPEDVLRRWANGDANDVIGVALSQLIEERDRLKAELIGVQHSVANGEWLREETLKRKAAEDEVARLKAEIAALLKVARAAKHYRLEGWGLAEMYDALDSLPEGLLE